MAYLSEFPDGRREQPRGSSVSKKWCFAIVAGAALTGVAIGKLLPDLRVGKGDDILTQMQRESEVKTSFRNDRYVSLLQFRTELLEEKKTLWKRFESTPDPGTGDGSIERQRAASLLVTVDILDHNARVKEFNRCLGDFPEFKEGKVHGETDKPAVPIEPLEEMIPFRVPAKETSETNNR